MSDTTKLIETESVKRFAFLGVTISTVATLTAIIAVPMLCLYMQHIQSGLQDELNFCRSRGESVKAEFNKVGRTAFHCYLTLLPVTFPTFMGKIDSQMLLQETFSFSQNTYS